MIQHPQVEETPTKQPGECFSCKATQLSPGRTWFLDTDVDYFDTPMYRIQVCNICFDLLANTCGYIKIGEEVEQYKKKISDLEGQIHELDRFRRYIDMLGIDPERLDNFLGLSTSNLQAEHGDTLDFGSEVGTGAEGTAKSVGRGKKGSTQSSDDEGVERLRPTKPNTSINI